MKRNFKSLLALTSQSALIIFPATYAFAAQQTPCDSPSNKDAIHCAYIAPAAQPISGKYIKIKESQKGHPATTKIFCAAPNNHTLKNIPQNLWLSQQSGENITWQFSQCLDEDCTTSKLLADDTFSVTKNGKVYASTPKNRIEIVLDPNYGINCTADAKSFAPNDTALQMRIDDAVDMIEYIPQALVQSAFVLTQMEAIAADAATGTYSPTQLANMDKQFQTLKDQLSKVQRVNTLDGYKNVSGGSLTIQIGYFDPYTGSSTLEVGIPAFNQYSLYVSWLDVLSTTNAQYAEEALEYAIDVVNGGLAMKKTHAKTK